MTGFNDVQAWIDEPAEGDRRSARARVAAARRSARGSIEVPPCFAQAPEYVTRWGAVEPPVGTVIRWVPDVNYPKTHAVVIRTAGGWTGLTAVSTWSDVVETIKNASADVATAWAPIPVVPEPEQGDDAVKSWASQFLTDAGGSPQVAEHTDSPVMNG